MSALLSRFIRSLSDMTRDTRLNITKTQHRGRNRYTLRVGGDYDWNSIVLCQVKKGIRPSSSMVAGGMTGDRVDLYGAPSKIVKRFKTVGDVMNITDLKFAHNANGDLLVSTGSTRAFKLVADDSYHATLFCATDDNLTML